MTKSAILIGMLLLTGCSPAVYVRDGVTDGDTFYLAPRALVDDDPVLQSWVSYSLTRSTCQLLAGGENPAKVTSYGCEFSARQTLLDTWEEQKREHPGTSNTYLDSLLEVRNAGFLDEYTVVYFAGPRWQVPVEVRPDDFRGWQRRHLRQHRPETRWVGSWGFKQQKD